MVMTPEQARQTVLNTDYPLDKIILLRQVSGTPVSIQFNHGLSFTPLIKTVWSLTPNFSTVYGVGNGPYYSNMIPFVPRLSSAQANSTRVLLEFGMAGDVTNVYIRVYGFMPSTVNTTASFTAESSTDFVLNTDYNYTKLYMSGVTGSSSTPGATSTVNHGLGYIPQSDYWYERSGEVYEGNSSSLFDGVPDYDTASINTSSISFTRGQYLPAERFHYRIYADGYA